MKTFVLILVLCLTVSASPLVYKTTKDIDSPDKYVELFNLDTSKFREIRIHVSSSKPDFKAVIKGVEADDELLMFPPHVFDISRVASTITYNTTIDTPPSKIRVFVWGTGTFKAYVWASQ